MCLYSCFKANRVQGRALKSNECVIFIDTPEPASGNSLFVDSEVLLFADDAVLLASG